VKFSDNYVYKAFRYLGIQSETKHKEHSRPRRVKDKYPNLIYTTWETVDRPRQVVVSDMTAIKTWWLYVEVTFYFDVFTKQILSWKVADRRGDRLQYINGLKAVILELKDNQEPTILHTDQGSVYASIAYNELIEETCIKRSMSRAGKPTDNPVNESLNGWIKEELFTDFRIDDCRDRDSLVEVLSRYVDYYNKQRPCFAIGYDTPDNYYRRFKRGEIPRKDTFSKRVLTEEPKFVRKRKAKKEETIENTVIPDDVSTPENETD
jgi:transposase InsO family protein